HVPFANIRIPARPTLFPYTTLFRSLLRGSGFSRDSENPIAAVITASAHPGRLRPAQLALGIEAGGADQSAGQLAAQDIGQALPRDRKSTRLNSSHVKISYAVFCLKK